MFSRKKKRRWRNEWDVIVAFGDCPLKPHLRCNPVAAPLLWSFHLLMGVKCVLWEGRRGGF